MCHLEEGMSGSGYHYRELLPSFHCWDTIKVPGKREEHCGNAQCVHRALPGEHPARHWAQGNAWGSRLLSWHTGSTAVPHRDAANALELMMPHKAEASPSSVVSATIHPQAMDQRGYEKIRRIHFNFKTWKFWHRRSLKKISSVMFQYCVEGECCILNVHAHTYSFE